MGDQAALFPAQAVSRPTVKPNAARKASNEQVIAAYEQTGNVWKAAALLGMCGQSVHERLVKLGSIKPMRVFSDAEKLILVEQYEAAANAGQLDALAATMGRTKPFIARQARALGLTDQRRPRAYLIGKASEAVKAWLAVNEHPRGMLGKKHAPEVCAAVAKAGRERWAAMSEDEREAQVLRQLRAKAAKNGGKLVPDGRVVGPWKAAWREIGGQRSYFRSRWEANYARYLQTLVDEGKIVSWEHEPETFWFEGIKRGSMSYLPDFRVTHLDGSVTYHEVKGWMDERSRVKIARMAKYHPEVALIVIGKAEYRKLNTLLSYVVEGWERDDRLRVGGRSGRGTGKKAEYVLRVKAA